MKKTTATAATIQEFLDNPLTPEYTSEPTPKKKGEVINTWQLVQAFKWYRENTTDTQAAKYLNCDVYTVKRFFTLAWCERLLSRGFNFPEAEFDSYQECKRSYNEYISTLEKQKTEKPKVDIKDLTKQRAMNMLGELENHLNDISPNWYELINSLGVKPLHVSYILDEIEKEKHSLEHPEVYDDMIADLNRIRKNKVKIRAPRKHKLIKPEKVIGALKYLKKSDEFKVESINPEALIGAKGLWIFNTQYRSVTHYVADGPNGFTVKGTTIKGFDPGGSTNKALRKPLEVLPLILDQTARQARKVINALSTKAYTPNGRINKHMVLLKIDR